MSRMKVGGEEEGEGGEEVQDKGVWPEGKDSEEGGGEESENLEEKMSRMKVGEAAKVAKETAKDIETELEKRGRSKRPRLQHQHQQAQLQPSPSQPDDGEEDIGVGKSAREGAREEVEAGAEEETIQGGLGVPVNGHNILEEHPTRNNLEKKKQMGTRGGMEGGQSRGEKGYGARKMRGKQLWDPGSSQESQDTG